MLAPFGQGENAADSPPATFERRFEMSQISSRRWFYGRLIPGIASLLAVAALTLTATAANTPAATPSVPQAKQMNFGGTATTTTPPTAPLTASAAPVVKAPKVKGF
jgi:hypothetical protein